MALLKISKALIYQAQKQLESQVALRASNSQILLTRDTFSPAYTEVFLVVEQYAWTLGHRASVYEKLPAR